MKHGFVTKMGTAMLAAMVTLSLSWSAFAGAPTDFVKERTKAVEKIMQKKESKKRTAKLQKVLAKTVDFRELAKRSLGEHWTARTPEQQQEFLDLLQRMLQANYSSKLSGKKLKRDYTVKYTKERLRGELAVVKTIVKYDEEKKPVDFRLLNKSGAWVVINITIDGISLEETYREDYTEIIVDEGWDSLINQMKKRVKELESGKK